MTDTVDAIARILTDDGPLSTDEVVERLRAEGVPDPEDVVDDLLEGINCPAGQLVDGRWVWLPALLAGRMFTHRVVADEIEHDLLTMRPDLGPIAELCMFEEYERMADGSPVFSALGVYDDELLEERGTPLELVTMDGALLLAPGTLKTLAVVAGDLVGLRLTDVGLVVERVPTASMIADIGERIVAALPADEPAYRNAAVWDVCVDDPDVFTEPVAPLGEILAGRGLVPVRDMVALPGFDAEAWTFERDSNLLAQLYRIDAREAQHLVVLTRLYENLEDSMSPSAGEQDSFDFTGELSTPRFAAAAAALADPYLAELLRELTVGGDGSPAVLRAFAQRLEPLMPRRSKVACRWLRACALERMGDIAEAEREFLAAESMDPDWMPVLLDLARFASDRGDADRALSLVNRAGYEDDPLRPVVEPFVSAPRTDVGRNDPCWCGSGRKYKKCHLGREEAPLEQRVPWLYLKACQHVFRTSWMALVNEVGNVRGEYASSDEEAFEMARDPLVMDAVLFEGGACEDFLAQRGFLLPADEHALVEQWLPVERSVFEVTGAVPGRALAVRDVRTGDEYDVRERTASRTLREGDLICARVVPTGDGFQIWGGLEPVALHYRNALIELLDSEPDAEELVEFLTLRFAPPTLINTEDEPLTMCEARLRVGPDIRATLDDAYEPMNDGEWCESVDVDGEAIDDYIRSRETKWLDESIPALDGVTPREAADDPTRRGDLITLLNGFPAVEGGMSADRLRAALGLT